MKNLKKFLDEYGELIRQTVLCVVVIIAFYLLFKDAIIDTITTMNIQNY